ncbi:MAG TPA: hypothetical protein DCM40_20370 [Maribacter sp.]|nr:hypothetical protein [Maribacter sp.]
MKPKERCPFHGLGFGITSDYVKEGPYEEIFFLMQKGNWSFSEAYSLPIGLRRWFVERTLTHVKESQSSKK